MATGIVVEGVRNYCICWGRRNDRLNPDIRKAHMRIISVDEERGFVELNV